MKLIVAGGRDYRLNEEDYKFLEELDKKYEFTEVATGRCKGADRDAEEWCYKNLIDICEDFAIPSWVWDYIGRKSGPIRNSYLAAYGKKHNAICVLFPGGRGTSDMFRQATEKGLEIILAPSWQGRHP